MKLVKVLWLTVGTGDSPHPRPLPQGEGGDWMHPLVRRDRAKWLRRALTVIAISAAVAAVAACRGGGSAPKGTVTIPTIIPTTPARNCQNSIYPETAPQFGDNASVAYKVMDVPVSADKTVKLKYFDRVEGTGAAPAADSVLQVNYTGWLNKDCIFDSSFITGAPVDLSITQLIRGWSQGLGSMKVGGKRRLEIPPELAYGPVGIPPVIPGNATLIFEVELVGLLTPPEATATVSAIITATTEAFNATATAQAATATARATPVTVTPTPK